MEKREKFASRLGFLLISAGCAIGIGNVWRFPYITGQYGGAAFLLIYFGFVALFGWVGLSGEFAFGRLTGTGPIGSYAYALRSRGKKGGGVLGAIPLLGSLGIAIGYAVIVGWVVRYCWGAVSRNISGRSPGRSAACCGTAWWCSSRCWSWRAACCRELKR